MSVGVKLVVELFFLIVYVQNSANELQREDEENKGVCYFPGSNLNTIFNGENVTFPVAENTIASYRCFDENVTMYTNDTIRCLANGCWSGELPICGNSTSWCPTSTLIEKVIPGEEMCIHFSRKIKRNLTEANETCNGEVNGTLIKLQTQSLQILLENNANYERRYYWIEAPDPIDDSSWTWINGGLPNATPPWHDCNEINVQDCCFALSNTSNFKWIKRDCGKTNAWICQSGYISCGYPDQKPVTLMSITKNNGRIPLEVEYLCPEGFTLNGNEKRQCNENGHWSGEAPICIRNINNSSECGLPKEIADSTKGMTVPSEDSTEDMEHKNSVYMITGAGSFIALVLIFAGIVLYRRKKKHENEANQKICPREVASFDSETLVSMEELYEEISLERRGNLKPDDAYEISDGYASIDELKRSEDSNLSCDADSIKRTFALPTLPEEHHSHLEEQNYSSIERNNHQEAATAKEKNFVMVDNDLYKCSDNSDSAESN